MNLSQMSDIEANLLDLSLYDLVVFKSNLRHFQISLNLSCVIVSRKTVRPQLVDHKLDTDNHLTQYPPRKYNNAINTTNSSKYIDHVSFLCCLWAPISVQFWMCRSILSRHADALFSLIECLACSVGFEISLSKYCFENLPATLI